MSALDVVTDAVERMNAAATHLAAQNISLAAELTALHQDAMRFRWLASRRGLELRSTAGEMWRDGNGRRFVSSHYLSADGVQYGPGESLGRIVDAAMAADTDRSIAHEKSNADA